MSDTDIGLTIARNAKGLRKAHGFTLQQVADRGGLAKSYVWEIENGKNTNPSIATLIGLCAALGCSLDGLVGREEYMRPSLRPEAMKIAIEVDTLIRAALDAREKKTERIEDRSLPFQEFLHTHHPLPIKR
jgi:transcriptional regulator with XRE-family HTH domain